MRYNKSNLRYLIDAGVHIGLIKKSRRGRVLAIAARGGSEFDLIKGFITDRISQLSHEYNTLEEKGLLVHYSFWYPKYFKLLYKARHMKKEYSSYLHICLKIESDKISEPCSIDEIQNFIRPN